MSESTRPQSEHPFRHFPAEGWPTLFAGVGMMLLLGLAIEPANGVVEPRTLSLVAALGYIFGFVLAKARLADIPAHLFSFLLGAAGVLVAVEPRMTWQSVRTLEFAGLFSRQSERADAIWQAFTGGARLPDDIARLSIMLTLYLVGYSSAWMLFRRGWFFWSVCLPAAIFLTSLAMDRDQPTWPALGFLVLAIVQGARFTSYTRTGRWKRAGIQTPRGIGRWSTIGGVALAVVTLVAALGQPLAIPDNAETWAVARSQSLLDTLANQADRLPTRDQASVPDGNYGEFADEFRVGEGVPTGDTEIALLRSAGPRYLAARKFDVYDGTGWSSGFSEAGNEAMAADVQAPPRVAFPADQRMNLPDYVRDNRSSSLGVITLYGPMRSGPLLTIETHYSASVPTAIRVGWVAVDEEFVIEQVSISDVPVDLRSLIGIVSLANMRPVDGNLSVLAPADPSLSSAILSEQESLLRQYPVETEIRFDPQLGVIVSASGRLPVYEDVEAVFLPNDAEALQTYAVEGLLPSMSQAEILSANGTYPRFVTDRYLGLPETVTPRTRELAQQVVVAAGATTPGEMALAIQNFLRTEYDYLLESSLAPRGQDIVDYFLFERKVGRCDHFATSMIVMLRSLDVPARLVTGLAPVQFDDSSSGFVYRARDAHAWVEVYLPGLGWVQFEPTPSESPLNYDQPGQNQGLAEQIEPTPTPTLLPEEPIDEPVVEATPAPLAPVQEQPPDSSMLDRGTTLPGILLVAVLGAVGLGLMGVAAWRWPLRGLGPGASYFLRFQRLARFLGVRPEPTLTPGEYAFRYAERRPRYADAAYTIADAYSGEQYGPPGETESRGLLGRDGWLAVRRSITSWRPWHRERMQ
ncbi:hypothetical protein BH23CHL5_BH23CHL5_21810 [soil metagenome]